MIGEQWKGASLERLCKDNDITFRTYCGLAGDPHELLIGETSIGIKVSQMYNRTGMFKKWNIRRAARKIIKEISEQRVIQKIW